MPSARSQFLEAQLSRLHDLLRESYSQEQLQVWGEASAVGRDWWLAERLSELEANAYYRLVSHIAVKDIPDLVVRLAQKVSWREFHLLGYAIWSSATLGQSLQLIMHLIEQQHPYVRLRLRTQSDQALLECRVLPGGALYYRLLIEECLLSVWQLIQTQLPGGLAVCASFAEFTYAAPSYHWRYQDFLGCRVGFRGERSLLAFPVQWLSVATSAGSQVAKHPDQYRVSNRLRGGELVAEVKALLRERPVESAFDMVKTARLMALSERSLRRHLAEAGVSFRQLVNEVKMQLAAGYLQSTDISVQEIGYLLGYAQDNNFHRAFRRHYQCSPSAFRASSRHTTPRNPGA